MPAEPSASYTVAAHSLCESNSAPCPSCCRFLAKECPARYGLQVPLMILAGTEDKTFLYNKELFTLAPKDDWYSSGKLGGLKASSLLVCS
jgi:hypothetical protein